MHVRDGNPNVNRGCAQELVANLRGSLWHPFPGCHRPAIGCASLVPPRVRHASHLPGGAALIIVGAAFVILARRELAQHGQPTDPGLPTSQLVTSGVFSVSRNPLYLGGVCILTRIALALDSPWVLAWLLPAIVASHYVLIAPEERYLAAKFGKQYHVYASKVGRWIGRARTARES